jgi:hypothetical protein
MNYSKLNENGQRLKGQLTVYNSFTENERKSSEDRQIINVAGVGKFVSTAYEQLRNAAEYAQEHLLMQKAMRRFYVRNISFQNKTSIRKTIAEELIIELTQSGYINNDTQPIERIDELKSVINRHYDNYWKLKKAGINSHVAQDWTLDLLSAEAENIIAKDSLQAAFVQFAYCHYQATLRREMFMSSESEDANYEASIYVSIHRALLKSDVAIVRFCMQQLYNVSDTNIDEYSKFHKNVDIIFSSNLTNKLTRYINKYGAPLRVFWGMIQDKVDMSEILDNRDRFNVACLDQIEKEYHNVRSKLNRGLIKSIAFLFITKSLIGLAIEVPYDLFIDGIVMTTPLTINLLTPVVYMALLRFGIKLPDQANTKAIQAYIDNMLYKDSKQTNLYSPRVKEAHYPIGFKVTYAVMFLVVFGLVTKLLAILDFNIVQGAIFFMFFAAASFLGFRLSRIVQELEIVIEKPGIIMTVRDFVFMPFTMLGKWLSEKYQKVNIVAFALDTIIELPLKTILRFIRQWTGFIDEKKDEI